MNYDIFDIESFNVISDENNYYFFRALNLGDIHDIENNITTTENGVIDRIRTDRDRYEKESKYTEESTLTLEEIFDHIKMHHRKDTNCISLTSNANVAAMYGRGYYKDKYVMVKIPKRDIGKYVVNAGSYILEEIEKRIENMLLNDELDDLSKYYVSLIDNSRSQQELDNILDRIKKHKEKLDDFEKGIEYSFNKTISIEYLSLNERQNFEKNKTIAKIDLINKNIIKNVSNKFLIQTIGNAFSSLELTHYKDIDSEKIIKLPSEFLDLFSIIQQVPENYSHLNELKLEILNYCQNNKEIFDFEYKDFKINMENDYTIEKMYNLTGGNVDFYSSIELYKKSFYLSKSKLRARNLLNLLNKITNNDPKYNEIINYILKNTYGVEPEIFSRLSKNKLQISESVNLEFRPKEEELFNFINNLSENDLKYIINNPLNALNYYLRNFKSIEYKNVDKETYYANAIIDLFNWNKLGVVSFNIKQRNDIVNKLKENNVVMVYEYLKAKGIKEQNIANVLLTTIIKEKELNTLELNDTFTIEELEHFLGYYKIKDTDGLKLRSYQATAVNNINKCFKEHQFCATVLPTGAGKSFVALAEMLKYKDKEILYLAPNDEILNQIENYIVKYIYGETLTKTSKEILKEVFPNLKLKTYSSLLRESGVEVVNHKYDFIIFDELHRTGAMDWGKNINELLNNQDDKTKVLGITATPQRDVDYKNMADEWARYFGYTEEEIQKYKHLAYNMDLNEAIELGYVVNPRVVNCEYTLEQDGSLENLQNTINLIDDEEKRNEAIKKLDILRRKVGQADGIEKVIGNNIKKGGQYIVFCPAFNKNNNIVEDEDGNIIDARVSGDKLLKQYQNELMTHLKNYYGVDDQEISSMVEFHSMLGEYSKTKNRTELEKFEQPDNDKIKFITVINKLNEGVHVKDIDGIIWFRPLDENSKILFLQQLGRIISSKDPNKEMSADERPIVIDLVNNILRVNLDKDKKQISNTSDLDRLIAITDWIDKHSGMMPDINSGDRVESNYASSLKRIQKQYINYIDNPDILEETKNKNEIIEILKLGNDIDLWSYEFSERIKKQKSEDGLFETFEVKGILKDFVELAQEINEVITPLSVEEKISEMYEYLMVYKKLPTRRHDSKFSDGSFMSTWLDYNMDKIEQYAFLENIYALKIIEYIESNKKNNLTNEEKIQEVYVFLQKNGKLPNKYSNVKFTNGVDMGIWLNNNKDVIASYCQSGYRYAVEINNAQNTSKFELKLNELYAMYKSNGRLPYYDENKKFSDEADVYNWIKSKKGKIKEYATKGDIQAVEIIDYIESQKGLSFEEKLQETYEYLKINGTLPKASSEVKFTDDTLMGSWLFDQKNKLKREQLCKEGNKDAIAITNYIEGHKTLSIEEKLKALYEYLQMNGVLPTASSKDRFIDGSLMGQWFFSSKVKPKRKELYEQGNIYAVALENYIKSSKKLSFEQKMMVVYNLLQENGDLPTYNENKKFTDGSDIYNWLNNKGNKIKLLNYLLKNNEYSQYANEIVKVMLKNNPSSFDKITEYIKAKTDFKKESFFEEIKEKIEILKPKEGVKNGQTNGRKI